MNRTLTLIATLGVIGAALSASAEGYRIAGDVFQPGKKPPDFGEPQVVMQVVGAIGESEAGVGGKLLKVQRDDAKGSFSFVVDIGEATQFSNRFAVFSAEAGEFILAQNSYVELKPEVAGQGEIAVQLPMTRRSNLAESYRREVAETLRKDPMTEKDYRRALAAALSATEIDPRLDNFLLALKTTGLAVADNRLDDPSLILTLNDLRARAGFGSLSFADRWRVEGELLGVLANAPEPEAEVNYGVTFREGAITLADTMLAELDPADPALRSLPVTRVFNLLNRLHLDNGDCPSIVASSRRAIELAPALAMNWASQRTLLLEWGDCLSRMSGIGDGRSLDAFVSDSTQQAQLREDWGYYASALKTAEANFLYPATDGDRRLKDLQGMADRIGE